MWRLSFDMTDYTNSVTVQKNLTEKEAQGLESAIKPGMWLCVQGKMEPTWDGKDIQLNPYHIQLAEHTAVSYTHLDVYKRQGHCSLPTERPPVRRRKEINLYRK